MHSVVLKKTNYLVEDLSVFHEQVEELLLWFLALPDKDNSSNPLQTSHFRLNVPPGERLLQSLRGLRVWWKKAVALSNFLCFPRFPPDLT